MECFLRKFKTRKYFYVKRYDNYFTNKNVKIYTVHFYRCGNLNTQGKQREFHTLLAVKQCFLAKIHKHMMTRVLA